MHRYLIYLILAAAPGALVTFGLVDALSAAERNIVLVVADDLSPDLGCYGNTAIHTPNLDRLAAEGTRYKHAFATTASCSASRSVILTGLHNHANGQYGHVHNYHHFSSHSWVESLPVMLERLGYRTATVGKYHVAPPEVFRFQQVFDAPPRKPSELVESCLGFLQEQSPLPFFLYIATDDPHRSSEFATELPNAPNRFGNPSEIAEGEHAYDPEDVLVPPFLPDTPACRAELAQYYTSVSRFDSAIGRLLEVLQETGHADDTLLVVTSDHGMAFPGAKTTVYEAGLQVPMIVRNPYLKSRQGVASNALVSLLDITPTLVDFAGGLEAESGRIVGLDKQKQEWRTFEESGEGQKDGVETGEMKSLPYTFHGRSFLSTLGSENPPGWDMVTASHTFHEIQMYYPMRVIRDREYKLIWNIAYKLPFPFASDLLKSPTWQAQQSLGEGAPYGFRTVHDILERPRFELFDMKNDPDETKNLADDPAYGEVLLEYIEKLKAFQQETGDPWMLKWRYE